MLIHDAQYEDEEYSDRIGWGHSSVSHLAAFAKMTSPERLVSFHHDPAHTDTGLDSLHERLGILITDDTQLVPGVAGLVVDV